MEFEGQYLTYAEYKSLGGSLEPTPFNLLEFEARKKIDKRTQNRLHGINDIPQDVKLCMFNLINRVEEYTKTINETQGNKASESIDGYSVSYITSSSIKEIIVSKDKELDGIIYDDLFGVIVNGEHLIYAGVK